MKMNGIWIRSQDKKRLIFATNVYIDDYGNFTLVKANSHIRIGEYPTKERALQVLDEIHARIASGTIEALETGTWHIVYIMPES